MGNARLYRDDPTEANGERFTRGNGRKRTARRNDKESESEPHGRKRRQTGDAEGQTERTGERRRSAAAGADERDGGRNGRRTPKKGRNGVAAPFSVNERLAR